MSAQAGVAEHSGLDEHGSGRMRFGAVLPGGPDAWSMLAAMAARTSVVRLGTMLTPLP